MTPLTEAQQHLDKAREFLEVAERALNHGQYNAAASNAVTSGINAKDAICLRLVGKTAKSDNHRSAVAELKKALPPTGVLAATTTSLPQTLSRLLSVKNRSQYESASVTASSAKNAVDWARRLCDGASQVLAG